MEQPRICQIPVSTSECEDKRYTHCVDCPHHEKCDMYWVSELWTKENKLNGKNSLLIGYLDFIFFTIYYQWYVKTQHR